MKIIFVNRYFFPDHSATSQMLSGIAFGLAKRGYAVTVVTSRQRYDDAKAVLDARQSHQGVSIIRIATSRFGRARLVGRAMDYVTFYILSAIAVFRIARQRDIIIAKTDPPMLSVVLLPVAGLRGARLINWLQDLFPEVATALGIGGKGSGRFISGVLTWLRDLSLRRADMNVVLGQRMADRVASTGVREDAIAIVPNWADGEQISPIPAEQNRLRKDWGLGQSFVVAYSGNLGRAHDYKTIVSAIEAVQSNGVSVRTQSGAGDASPQAEGRPLRWLFVGGGAELERLKKEVAVKRLSSVDFKPYQPNELLAQSLSAGDVHLITLKPELEGFIVPSKFYGIAAAGRAMIFIGDPDGELARIIGEEQIGLTVPQGDGGALYAAVMKLASDRDLVKKMGQNARTLFEAKFDLSRSIEAWDKILSKAVGSGKT